MSRPVTIIVISVLPLFFVGCQYSQKEKLLADFIKKHVEQIEPLEIQYEQAYWDGAATGRKEAFERQSELKLKMGQIHQDAEEFAFLKSLKESGQIKDPKLARQLDKLYYAYLKSQINPDLLKRIVELDTNIQNTYNNYRGSIEGEKVVISDIYTIMTTEKDCHKRELAWRASKEVGNVIVGDLIELVKLRNEAARDVGFENYHTLSVTASEQRLEELDRIFDELNELTAEPFSQMKAELDKLLADSYGIDVNELRPWHYHDPFFQRSPLVYELDLDDYYAKADVRTIAERYYEGVDLPVDDILARSDLYDREGKYPHAFGQSMDRRGNARILCNLQNTERWMETILHELGHAIYSKYHDTNEPYLLREPAHSFTTEAVAMFFGRLSRNAGWMKEMLELSEEERDRINKVSNKYLQFQQILFARWVLVMYNFEKQLYANPGQDLNNLWWDLVEKYQFVQRPQGPVDAGWASKLHFVTAPCYYHNYMLGELLASQWHYYLLNNILAQESDRTVSYVGDERIGRYFRDNVFGPGAEYHWNEMIKRSTGEKLTPKYFVNQFVK